MGAVFTLALPFAAASSSIAACAAASRATGTRKGEQLTYVSPMRWQNFTESGSPPCSPQMPSLISGRVLLALLDRDLHQQANARLIDGRERILLHDLQFRIAGRNEPESSRLMPSAICVRSFVPKLKNSAVSAISSAVKAPRGTSIIVPTR